MRITSSGVAWWPSITVCTPMLALRRRLWPLVATGSVTHSFDNNQRFLELPFYRDGEDGIRGQLPVNAFETPPGHYLLFAFDEAGTPSMARMIRINPVTP